MADMKTELKQIGDLLPYALNSRDHSDEQVRQIAASIDEFGFNVPVLLEADGRTIVAGHGRVLAANLLGLAEVPTFVLGHLTPAQARAYRIADNAIALKSDWNEAALQAELDRIIEDDEIDLESLGLADLIDTDDGGSGSGDGSGGAGSLAERFGVPPFSVLNAREGTWQARKAAWITQGIESELGRDAVSYTTDSKKYDYLPAFDTGVSIFDPVVCELAYTWFSPPGGLILDPFAGGSVRGVVAALLGRRYLGVDLRAEQVAANGAQWDKIAARQGKTPARPVVSDPDAATPIEKHGDNWIKRDDLFEINGAPGGKVRTCLALAQRAKDSGAAGITTAGSRSSPQVNIVARVAAHLGLKARCHTPKGKLSPEVIAARDAGAVIEQHKPGHNSVIIARAREDAKARKFVEIPFGMECEEAITQTRRQVQDIPADVARIVIPVGSGMSLAGLLHGLDDAGRGDLPVVGVKVGADPAKRLDKYAPANWRDRVDLIDSGTDYHDPAPDTTFAGLPLDPHYEGKCVPHIAPGDLFWIVGIRATALPLPVADDQAGPSWIAGDSAVVIPDLPGDPDADFLFTCPPYADLEVYSDDPRDLSNMPYADFVAVYRTILSAAAARLKPDSFAAIVVGEIRDRKGIYRNFVGDTVAAMRDAGLDYYNEAILVSPVGSLAIRAGKSMTATRKIGKTHQNILVFVKGDPKRAAGRCGPVYFDEDAITAPEESAT